MGGTNRQEAAGRQSYLWCCSSRGQNAKDSIGRGRVPAAARDAMAGFIAGKQRVGEESARARQARETNDRKVGRQARTQGSRCSLLLSWWVAGAKGARARKRGREQKGCWPKLCAAGQAETPSAGGAAPWLVIDMWDGSRCDPATGESSLAVGRGEIRRQGLRGCAARTCVALLR